MADPRPIRPRLDADALAHMARDPHDVYLDARSGVRSYLVRGDMAAFDAVLDAHLGSLVPVHLLRLIDYVAEATVERLRRRAINASYNTPDDDPPPPSPIPLLVRLVERIQLDQAGWDFVGIALFVAYVRVCHGGGPAGIDVNVASAIATDVLRALIGGEEGGTVRVPALLLTWDRLRGLSLAWMQRGDAAVYRIGQAMREAGSSMAVMDQGLAVIAASEGAIREAWNASIREAEQQMRRDMYASQQELRRDPRIAPDAIGVIAQFLAPPGTTQADLQRQRELYTATVGVARLQMQADTAPDDRELQARANLARGAAHMRRDYWSITAPPRPYPLPLRLSSSPEAAAAAAAAASSSPRRPPPPPHADDESDRSKKQRLGGRLVRPW